MVGHLEGYGVILCEGDPVLGGNCRRLKDLRFRQGRGSRFQASRQEPQGLYGLRFEGLRVRTLGRWALEFRMRGLRFRVQGLEFRVQGLGLSA